VATPLRRLQFSALALLFFGNALASAACLALARIFHATVADKLFVMIEQCGGDMGGELHKNWAIFRI
jgi:hypothetical protein